MCMQKIQFFQILCAYFGFKLGDIRYDDMVDLWYVLNLKCPVQRVQIVLNITLLTLLIYSIKRRIPWLWELSSPLGPGPVNSMDFRLQRVLSPAPCKEKSLSPPPYLDLNESIAAISAVWEKIHFPFFFFNSITSSFFRVIWKCSKAYIEMETQQFLFYIQDYSNYSQRIRLLRRPKTLKMWRS